MEVVIFGKVCVPNKTEDLNIYVFNMIARKNDITINVDASVKSIIHMKNNIFGILLHAVAKMEDI